MGTPLRSRATVIVDLQIDGTQGVLVHATHVGEWLLPGGGRETYPNGQPEPLLATAVRELYEETGLVACGGFFWRQHAGGNNLHNVFILHTVGTPALVNVAEAPMLGLCRPDMQIVPLASADPAIPTTGQLLSTAMYLIQTYYAQKATNPAPFAPSAFAYFVCTGD